MKIILLQLAQKQLDHLQQDHAQVHIIESIHKALEYLSIDVRHPLLHTHEFHGITGEHNEKVFEAYVNNHTPHAYRILWHYGPEENSITIISIIPHR